jgi:hypothetical protein
VSGSITKTRCDRGVRKVFIFNDRAPNAIYSQNTLEGVGSQSFVEFENIYNSPSTLDFWFCQCFPVAKVQLVMVLAARPKEVIGEFS